MYVPRIQTRRLRELARRFPVLVVAGARQVGKSTLLEKLWGRRAQSVVFDPLADVENARRDPDLFLQNRRPPLILDEIQYAPELVSALKRRVDRDRAPGRYFLTGSQQWGVLKRAAESLAGRAVFLDLEGFCLSETARLRRPAPWLLAWLKDPEAFLLRRHRRLPLRRTLFEQVWRGWLPEAQFLPAAAVPDFHAAYQRTYLERDVRALADVADWQLFGRFVRLLAALSAQEINHSQLGRELGLTPQTSARWLAILKAAFQWHETPAYHGNALKRLSARPKGYAADTGVACHALAVSTPAALGGHPAWGPLFETAVAGEVRKQLSLLAPRPNLYHWRAHGGAEVDLLLERDGRFFPIEIKASTRLSTNDARGLAAFRETYPRLNIAPGLVLAPVETVFPLAKNAWAVPWDLAV
jgi:hypothetical protein